jgi:cell shape-determining protein MreD
MALFVRMIIIAVNMTLHNNIFHSNSYIILICVMCLWPGLVVDTRYNLFQNQKSTNSASTSKIHPTTSATFVLVCLQVSEKSEVMRENCWTVVLVVVHRVFLFSFYYFTQKV